MSSSNSLVRFPVPAVAREAAQWSVLAALRPLHALMASPVLLFMATLTAMLFFARPMCGSMTWTGLLLGCWC
jgi:hypothetical protein